MNILFYSPLQSRSKDTESVMEGLVLSGDQVFLLTQYESRVYHEASSKLGVRCFATTAIGTEGIVTKLKQIIFLVRFCRKHEIDVLYSQLEPANLIAVIAQYFVRSKVVLVRHHVDIMETDSTKFAHALSIICYKLARKVIVVSNMAKRYMIEKEGIRSSKIVKINLGYNFSFWESPNTEFIQKRKSKLPSGLVLVVASRLVKSKRIDLTLLLLKKLDDFGIDCCVLVLGMGEEEENLKRMAANLGISHKVFFEGYVPNVVDYVLMADLLVHLSLTESSATVVKEAGLAQKPVVICKGVGDFEDYIEDRVSGFFVSKENPLNEAFERITEFCSDRSKFRHMGENLRSSVLKNFSIGSVLPQYLSLNRQLVNP